LFLLQHLSLHNLHSIYSYYVVVLDDAQCQQLINLGLFEQQATQGRRVMNLSSRIPVSAKILPALEIYKAVNGSVDVLESYVVSDYPAR
jgi:hypothetical protein